ncbi:MAG: ABC transporter permease [Paracoccaceae bacterium]
MFEPSRPPGKAVGAIDLLTLIYHSAVRNIRKTHGNAMMGLVMNMMQTVMFVLAFYVMFAVLGMRGNAIRGNFLLYIMSGIFLFMTHNKALGAVVGSEGPASPMMKHAPMNTVVAICAAALSSLYIQVLSMSVVLYGYHVIFEPIHIEEPIGAMGMVLLAWLSGVAIGLVMLAVKPWFPDAVRIVATVYQRANMITSGKMFVANTLPATMLPIFNWNPLFHTIDQCRGFVFINYNPHFSSISYPVYLSLALIMIGLMGEFYTRKHASVSWYARR